MAVFEFGGNRRLAEFFTANGVSNSIGEQRYLTPSATWYREEWIKARTQGQEVANPPEGVVIGPCVDCQNGRSSGKRSEPAVTDLLDFGASQADKAGSSETDLLSFGNETFSASNRSAPDADLLGVEQSSTTSQPVANASTLNDLLGLGPGPGASNAGGATSSADLLGFSIPDKTYMPGPSTLANPSLSQSPSTQYNGLPGLFSGGLESAGTVGVSGSANSQAGTFAAPFGGTSASQTNANTLGGGAKLEDQPKKDDDPLAMALQKWGM